MMKRTSFLKVFLISSIFSISSNFVLAQSYSPSISFFRTSPRLIDSNTSFKTTYVRSRYNFVVEIPANADNNLSKIVFNQQQNSEIIKIYPKKTRVSLYTKDGEIPIENSTTIILNKQKKTNQITVDLAQSIPAGSTVKITLRAKNPDYSGIYQFGVEVYPEGNNPRSLYLGIARFHFYRHGLF